MTRIMKRPRVLVADDHSITRTGIQSLIEADYEMVAEVGDGRAAVQEALRLRPDLIILDIALPLLNGIDAARQIKEAWPEARVLFVSMHSNASYLRAAMSTGASGYVLKASAAEELLPAVERALRGKTYISPAFEPGLALRLSGSSPEPLNTTAILTGRQREVLQLVAEGFGNKEIASILSVSVKTVEFHRSRIMSRLGLHSIAEIAAYAIREGLVAP